MVSRSIFSKNHPWVNRDFHFDSEVSEDIVYHLSCGSFGDVKMNNNVYFLFGFASRGYLEIEKKISEADEILSELDQIHGQNGYIIIHNGDGTYVLRRQQVVDPLALSICYPCFARCREQL